LPNKIITHALLYFNFTIFDEITLVCMSFWFDDDMISREIIYVPQTQISLG